MRQVGSDVEREPVERHPTLHAHAQRADFRLVVAIADVSHYVANGDPLDADSRDRGTSVYFPRRVIPMLPEALSNELCSLKAGVDRLCMACDMSITAKGDITGYRFYPAVMHSRARLTYNPRFEAYELDIEDEELRHAPSFRADKDFDWGDRSQEAELHRYYGIPPYWGGF